MTCEFKGENRVLAWYKLSFAIKLIIVESKSQGKSTKAHMQR